jgi:hypothetical protein
MGSDTKGDVMDFRADLTSEEQQFLRELHDKLGGDTGGSVSMFDVGDALGMDRSASSRVAENLMGSELVEVRTLSGAIGITPAALEMIGNDSSGPGETAGLGPGPVITDTGRLSLEPAVTELKHRLGGMRLEFDRLSELVADLNTLDAQLASPRPKTAILRACLESITDVLTGAGEAEPASRLTVFMNA